MTRENWFNRLAAVLPTLISWNGLKSLWNASFWLDWSQIWRLACVDHFLSGCRGFFEPLWILTAYPVLPTLPKPIIFNLASFGWKWWYPNGVFFLLFLRPFPISCHCVFFPVTRFDSVAIIWQLVLADFPWWGWISSHLHQIFKGASIWVAFQTKANVRLDSEKEKRVLPYRGEMFHFLWCPYFSCHFTPTLRLQSVDHSPADGHLTCPLHSFPKATLTLGGLGRGGRGLKGGMGRGKEDGKRITGERGICWKNKSALREAPQESSLVLS